MELSPGLMVPTIVLYIYIYLSLSLSFGHPFGIHWNVIRSGGAEVGYVWPCRSALACNLKLKSEFEAKCQIII